MLTVGRHALRCLTCALVFRPQPEWIHHTAWKGKGDVYHIIFDTTLVRITVSEPLDSALRPGDCMSAATVQSRALTCRCVCLA